eukprot:TRINITY_DN5861_c0_g1_i2.p1 TRINITY_DN5861_c0_g1~~TRINITY_DN5861_c0_g1_i2.p1  ORF type:complete len:332 (-),score=59.50 TRINITY_DN5861_c0_g1_i2:399-1394(-)
MAQTGDSNSKTIGEPHFGQRGFTNPGNPVLLGSSSHFAASAMRFANDPVTGASAGTGGGGVSVKRTHDGSEIGVPERGSGIVQVCNISLPPDIRLEFIKKVYSLVLLMVLVTFAICQPFIFAETQTLRWFAEHMWVLAIVLFTFALQYLFSVCMMCQMCCGGTSLMEAYLKMFKTAPWNFIYLFIYSVVFGVLVGFVCASYTVSSVLLAFGVSALLIIAITIYAIRTKADFTGSGPYILVMFVGLVSMMLIGSLLPFLGTFFQRIVACIGAIFFGFIIVYDTQLIFGSAGLPHEPRQWEYTVDMYAFAAWNLYLDFINFFLHVLMLIGSRD